MYVSRASMAFSFGAKPASTGGFGGFGAATTAQPAATGGFGGFGAAATATPAVGQPSAGFGGFGAAATPAVGQQQPAATGGFGGFGGFGGYLVWRSGSQTESSFRSFWQFTCLAFFGRSLPDGRSGSRLWIFWTYNRP